MKYEIGVMVGALLLVGTLLTTGPATGRAIADLAAGRAPTFDVTPFAAERFA